MESDYTLGSRALSGCSVHAREAGSGSPVITSSRQLVEQRLCFFEIEGVEAFCEPVVSRCEEITCLGTAALVAAELREVETV